MSTRLTRNARRLPWVTRLRESSQCRAAVPSALSIVRACRMPAWWRFDALVVSEAKSGDYCWQHLNYACLGADQHEEKRADDWFAKHGVVD